MPKSILITTFLLIFSVASIASGQDRKARFETIYNLSNIQALTFDSKNNELLVATSGSVRRWAIDPLRLVQTIPIDTLVSDMQISPNGLVFAVGQSWDQETIRILGGSAIALRPLADGNYALFNVWGADQSDSNSDFAQVTSIAFDGEQKVYLGSPVDVSVNITPDEYFDGPLADGTTRENLFLECGPSAQFLIFPSKFGNVYSSATTEGAKLEVGLVLKDFSSKKDGETKKVKSYCMKVQDVNAKTKNSPAFQPAKQQVIVVDEIDQEGVSNRKRLLVVLEPNANELHLFEPSFDEGGNPKLQRLLASPVKLNRYNQVSGSLFSFNLLSASNDGGTILISGSSKKQVLRFSIAKDKIINTGKILTNRPIRRIATDYNGKRAFIGVGEAFGGGDVYLHLLNNLDQMPKTASIPKKDPSIGVIQAGLNRVGINAGHVDGFIGKRTISAAQAFFNDEKIVFPEGETVDMGLLRQQILAILPNSITKD